MKINITNMRFKIARWLLKDSVWIECTKEIEDGVKELLGNDYPVGEIIKRWSFFYQTHPQPNKCTDGVRLQITAKLTKLTKETKNEENIIDDKFIDDLIGRRMR